MSKKTGLIAFFIIISSQLVLAQENRYMVFFTDKENSSFSLDKPEEFLSERAIQRRLKQDIPVTNADLPVNMGYLQQLDNSGADVFFSSKWMNAALVQMDERLVNSLVQLDFVREVEYIAPGAKLSSSKDPVEIPETFDEPAYKLADSKMQLGMINADDMHADGYTGKDVWIAVFDAGFTGVNRFKPFEHLHINNRVVAVNDFVYNSGNPYQYHDHGTEVLSVIAADYLDFQGTAYDASFVLAVTEDVRSEFRIEEYNWLLAAEFADSVGVDIIHSSLGYSVFGKEPSMNYTYEDLDGYTATITQAVNFARDRGILVVTSAGNEGNSNWQYITAPADARGILTVGAVTENYEKASFSSIGPTADGRIKPDVMALGSGTAVMFGNGGISQSNGTSYAAPLVAGLAAGIWQANPEWSNIDVINAIKYTSSRSLNPDALFGYGIPDYKIARQGAVLSVDQIINRDITVYPNPFRDSKIYIDTRRLMDSGAVQLTLYDQKGSVIVRKMIVAHKERIMLDVPGVKAGSYFLKIHSEKFSKTVKLIKY